MRNIAAWCLVLSCVLAGCEPPEHKLTVTASPPAPVETVDAVVLEVIPVALNWDGQPGPDGLEARVSLFQEAQALPLMVGGTIEFVLYEGRLSGSALADARPHFTWSYGGDELRQYATRGLVGWGYTFRLAWGRQMPASEAVTLVARYLPRGAQGRAVASRPLVILIDQR